RVGGIQNLDFSRIGGEKVIVQSGVVILDERIDPYAHTIECGEFVVLAVVVDRECSTHWQCCIPRTGWKCVVSGLTHPEAHGAARQEQKPAWHDEIGLHNVEIGKSLSRHEYVRPARTLETVARPCIEPVVAEEMLDVAQKREAVFS